MVLVGKPSFSTCHIILYTSFYIAHNHEKSSFKRPSSAILGWLNWWIQVGTIYSLGYFGSYWRSLYTGIGSKPWYHLRLWWPLPYPWHLGLGLVIGGPFLKGKNVAWLALSLPECKSRRGILLIWRRHIGAAKQPPPFFFEFSRIAFGQCRAFLENRPPSPFFTILEFTQQLIFILRD